jgi:hypothetical protein
MALRFAQFSSGLVVVLVGILTGVVSCTAIGGFKGNEAIISLSDLSHPPTVRLNWPILEVICPPSNNVSSAWIEISGVRQKRLNRIVLTDKYVLREKPTKQKLDLSTMDISEKQIPFMRNVWRNQDNSSNPLQIIGKR